jgi:hypothetical protein
VSSLVLRLSVPRQTLTLWTSKESSPRRGPSTMERTEAPQNLPPVACIGTTSSAEQVGRALSPLVAHPRGMILEIFGGEGTDSIGYTHSYNSYMRTSSIADEMTADHQCRCAYGLWEMPAESTV